MKKNNVQLASLILFSALFAPGVVVGMDPTSLYELRRTGKELPERAPQILSGEKPFDELPPDTRKIIANYTLRLILNEADNNSEMLMQKKEKSLSFMQMWELGPFARHFTMPIIDFVILLIENGANPNIKSNQGNTVLHFLMGGLLVKVAYWQSSADENLDLEFETFHYVKNLMLKIELLMRHAINVNEQDNNGNTIAHGWIQARLSTPFLLRKGSLVQSKEYMVEYTSYLMSKGVDFTTIKNFEGLTPCQLGFGLIKQKQRKSKRGYIWKDVLNDICGCEGQ